MQISSKNWVSYLDNVKLKSPFSLLSYLIHFKRNKLSSTDVFAKSKTNEYTKSLIEKALCNSVATSILIIQLNCYYTILETLYHSKIWSIQTICFDEMFLHCLESFTTVQKV